MERKFVYKIEDKYVGRPILDVLKNHFLMSAAIITKLKKYKDGIIVNNNHEFVNYVLKKNDILYITLKEEESKNIIPIDMPIDILYEDEDILAVNKPAFMPTHTSMDNHNNTLSNAVLFYLNKNGQKHTFHGVTRLDKNTSGIVLIAKNGYVHDLLSRQLREGNFKKEYMCIVHGNIASKGFVDKPIKRINDSIIKRKVDSDGQDAFTEYEPVKIFDQFTLLKVYPKTGRTHQIRVHMSYIGHPIVGDDLYGGERLSNRSLLSCVKISFFHPILQKEIIIKTDIPCDFNNFIKK